jgi:uncharacterized protein YbbK (DUF523 family)
MKIIVSACLLGCNCRYDGNHSFNKKVNDFIKGHEVFLVCPEVEGGLPTPRIPAEINKDRKVINKEGQDVTSYFEKGAKECLKVALNNQVDLAILKARSPSCGNKEIYDGTFSGKLIKGQGIFAKYLKKHNIKIINEEEL